MSGLWCGPEPLILASQSETRRLLLEQAGIPCLCVASDVDERALQAGMADCDGPAVSEGLAEALARAKAMAVSPRFPARLILAADQTLMCEGRLFNKPADRAAARRQLQALRGRPHSLRSAFALVQNGTIHACGYAVATLQMRAFDDAFLDAYLDAAGTAVLTSVGAYQIEVLGIHLFAAIEGEHSTILGLPMPAILVALRNAGCLAH